MFTAPKQQIRSNTMPYDPELDHYHHEQAAQEAENATDWLYDEFLDAIVALILNSRYSAVDALSQVPCLAPLSDFFDHIAQEVSKIDSPHPDHYTMSAFLLGDVEQVHYWTRWMCNLLDPVAVAKYYEYGKTL
jgi:hypothetical protein